jgi:hypothetical protein
VPVLVGVQWKKEKNKLAKFNYKKWVTENRYGKQPHLFEKEEEEIKRGSRGIGRVSYHSSKKDAEKNPVNPKGKKMNIVAKMSHF